MIMDVASQPSVLYSGVQSGTAAALPSAELFASPVLLSRSFTPKPYLASSWTYSADKLHLTLNLVHNATFTNGSPVTSQDIAFSISAIEKYHPFGKELFGDVTSVDTPNQFTAVINLSHPDPSLFIALSPPFCPILPESVYGSSPNLLKDTQLAQNVVGSGPFKLVSYTAGQTIVMKKNPHFFIPGEPKLNEIIINNSPSAVSTELALQNGSVQMAPGFVSPTALKQMSSDHNLVISNESSYGGIGGINWLEYNLKNPILSKLSVRQAIADAINRQGAVNLLFGYGQATGSPIYPTSPYYQADPNMSYSPSKAIQLLNAAGYKPGPNGVRFTLDLTVSPGSAPEYGSELANLIKADLGAVGIGINIQTYPDAVSWGQAVSHYNYALDINNYDNWGDPSIGVSRAFVCSNIRPGILFANMTQYCNPQVDQLFAQAATATSQAAAKVAYGKVQTILAQQLPVDVLTTVELVNVYSTKVVNPPNGVWGAFSPMLTTYLAK